MNRYARQMILPEMGEAGQSRLAAARVLVVGAGGLAAPALPLLAGAGVGALRIVDGDRVEESNLHRQTLFAEPDCGAMKAEVAAARCRALNSDCRVEAVATAMTPANVDTVLDDVDVVLDCADSYAASYVLSDACFAAGLPLISASVLGMSGYAGGFCGGAPSLRAVFPDAPESGASCATAGVLGPVVGVLGAVQAQMALAVLLGLDPAPLGQVVRYDGRTCQTKSFRFDGAPEPERAFQFVAPCALNDRDVIVDLRSAEEAPEMAHPKARRVLPGSLAGALPDGADRLALCCTTGLRAWRAAEEIEPNWPGEIVLVAAKTT